MSDSVRSNELVDEALRLLAQAGLGARMVGVVGSIVEARGTFGGLEPSVEAELQKQHLELTGAELRLRVDPAPIRAG